MDRSGHIIDKLRVEVRAGRREAALQLQEQLGFQLHSGGFAAELESLLDRLVPADTYFEIPKLQLEIDCEQGAKFGALLLRELEAAIRERIRSTGSGEILLKGPALTDAEGEFFLRYGIQPYAAPTEVFMDFVRRLRALPGQADAVLETWLVKWGRRDEMVWRRVFFLLGAVEMRRLVLRMFGFSENELLGLLHSAGGGVVSAASLLELDARSWGVLVQAAIAAASVSGGGVAVGGDRGELPVAATGAVVTERSGVRPAGDGGAFRARDEKYERQLELGIPVGNSGVTLLWREYGGLLKRLGWVREMETEGKGRLGFAEDGAKQRAIWLMDYLVWGAVGSVDSGPSVGGRAAVGDALGEDRLLLNKILCDWPVEEPVDPGCYPDGDALAAADRLLAEWLDGWKKDRVLSVAWFRAAFLQRPGAVSRRVDESWVLTVEKRTEDVLIVRPSMVRYPWMPRLLFVEW